MSMTLKWTAYVSQLPQKKKKILTTPVFYGNISLGKIHLKEL